MARYYVTLDGSEHVVELEQLAPCQFKVVLDGAERHIDACTPRPDTISLLIDGRSHDVAIERVAARERSETLAARCNVRLQSLVIPVEVLDERRHNLRAVAGDTAVASGRCEIIAPMPGKVVKLLVERGARVEAGQGVVVVEAMKMENEIKCPGAGTVVDVRAQPGQAVDRGTLLLVVE